MSVPQAEVPVVVLSKQQAYQRRVPSESQVAVNSTFLAALTKMLSANCEIYNHYIH